MRFSSWLPSNETWPTTRRRAELLAREGWAGVWLSDMLVPSQRLEMDLCEVWSTLAALAASVDRVRLGSLVSSNTYRHPALVAKVASTVHSISGGRLTLGLGAGRRPRDHQTYGFPLPDAGTRTQMLVEACAILRPLLDGQSVTFMGNHYRVEDLRLNPSPTSAIELLLGTRDAGLVSRFADQWHLFDAPDILPDRLAALYQECEKLSRDPREISIIASPFLLVATDPALIRRVRAEPGGHQVHIGRANEIIDEVGKYAALGVDELALPSMAIGDAEFESLSHFAQEVAPCFRDGAA